MLNQVVGATGDGVVVAVIDTGVNLSHEVLQPNALMQNPALDQATVEGIDTLGKGQYINAKIPFSYDYKDRDNDCTDQNGHGSHVSGIIGGYRTVEDEVVFSGAAPAVQILGMKVFGATGGTSSDIYFAALEDAYRLGADVINMSLGSPSGFTYDDSLETELYGNIYQKLDEAGIVVFCSAGNDTNLSEGAMNLPALFEQLAYVRTDLVDYGVVGTPSTYPWNTSVASADNMAFPIDGISLDGVHFHPGADSQEETALGFVKNLEGKSFEFLYLDSIGAEADYEGIDVAGKLIAVNRGEISFQDKIDIAAAHGAIGCIVVDNVVGKMINMSLENVTIPSMSLVLSARANLLALSGQTVTLSTGEAIYNNPEAGIMSSFSSWGTTTDLAFKPQITGIGGMVYSCVNGASDAYELMSGTSMACPNVVGSFAAMLQWMRMLYPTLDKHALSVLTENLLLSTAMVLGNGQAFYSPRQQGAGLANVVNAVLAPAYITNANQSLGYDKEGTGKLEVTYHVVSLSEDTEVFYLEPNLVTDAPVADQVVRRIYNSLTPMSLAWEEDFDCTVTATYADGTTDEGNVLTLEAGAEMDVTLSISVSEEAIGFLSTYFTNGFFLDGFLLFYDYAEVLDFVTNGGDMPYDLFHGSFISFCGDWLAAPALESISSQDLIDAMALLQANGIEPSLSNVLAYGLVEFNIGWNEAYIFNQTTERGYDLGRNPFSDTIFFVNSDRNAFSTALSEQYLFDSIYMMPTVLRNCQNLIMTVTDAETGDVYYVDDTPMVAKDALDAQTLQYQHRTSFLWDGTDLDGNYVPSGTKATITFESILYHPDAERKVEWTIDVTVDYTAPEVYFLYDDETKTLEITASDEEYLAYVNLYAARGGEYVDLLAEALDPESAGESFTWTVDLSDCEDENLYLEVVDYASNVVSYRLPMTIGSFSNVPADVTVEVGDGFLYEAITDEVAIYDLFGFILAVEDGHCLTGELPVVTVDGAEILPSDPADYGLDALPEGMYLYVFEVPSAEVSVTVTGAQAHAGEWEVTKKETCTEAGERVKICTNCGEVFETEVIAAKGHTPGQWIVIKEATCSETGLEQQICPDCGEVLSTVVSPKRVHTAGEWEVTKEATCTEAGERAQKCTLCGEVLKTEAIPAKGHTAGEWEVTKEATYTEAGERVKKCTVCGEVLETEVIPKLAGTLGDPNCDGKIDYRDYILVKRYCVEVATLTDEQFRNSDVNGDGVVNFRDYIAIKRMVLGIGQ